MHEKLLRCFMYRITLYCSLAWIIYLNCDFCYKKSDHKSQCLKGVTNSNVITVWWFHYCEYDCERCKSHHWDHIVYTWRQVVIINLTTKWTSRSVWVELQILLDSSNNLIIAPYKSHLHFSVWFKQQQKYLQWDWVQLKCDDALSKT